MPQRRIEDWKLKEILRLKFGRGLSIRLISQSVDVSVGCVQNYLCRANAAGVSWPIPEDRSQSELWNLIFPEPPTKSSSSIVQPDWWEILLKHGMIKVTLRQLWQEYRANCPTGYAYSHFCSLYTEFLKKDIEDVDLDDDE